MEDINISMRRKDGSLSRTQQLNAVLAVLGVVVGLFPQLQSQIDPELYPWLLVGLSGLYAYLRATTTQGLQG